MNDPATHRQAARTSPSARPTPGPARARSGHDSSGGAPGPHPADPATHANPATPAAPAHTATPATPAAGGNRNVGLLVAVGIAVLVVLAAIVGLVVK